MMEIYDGGNPEIQFERENGAKQKQWLLMSQRKQMKRRDGDIIVKKMGENEKLTKKEEKMLNSEVKNHIWYHMLKQCMNKHCWIASKHQFCTQCRQKTKQCSCAERMRQVPCAECKKLSIHCECGLKDELTIQKVLNTALEEYENDKELSRIKIKSINHLAALMA